MAAKTSRKPITVAPEPEPQPLAVPGETWDQKQINGYLAATRAKSKGERRGLRLLPPLLVKGPDGMFDLNQGEYVDADEPT